MSPRSGARPDARVPSSLPPVSGWLCRCILPRLTSTGLAVNSVVAAPSRELVGFLDFSATLDVDGLISCPVHSLPPVSGCALSLAL